jgi:hypothetical protein
LGAIAGLTARRQDTDFFYKFVSFLYPGSTFRVDLATGTTTTFRETIVKGHIATFLPSTCISRYRFLMCMINAIGLDASLFEVEQAFYTSKDETKIPMFIIKSKSSLRDGSNPTMLYGYGGFNIALMPSFSIGRLLWIMHLGSFHIPLSFSSLCCNVDHVVPSSQVVFLLFQTFGKTEFLGLLQQFLSLFIEWFAIVVEVSMVILGIKQVYYSRSRMVLMILLQVTIDSDSPSGKI